MTKLFEQEGNPHVFLGGRIHKDCGILFGNPFPFINGVLIFQLRWWWWWLRCRCFFRRAVVGPTTLCHDVTLAGRHTEDNPPIGRHGNIPMQFVQPVRQSLYRLWL